MSRTPEKASVQGHGRRLLLEAARELFAEKGYRGANLKDIAERAGVSETMLYRHFGTKAALFEEAAVQPIKEHIASYVNLWDQRVPGVSPPIQAESRTFFSGLYHALRSQRELLLDIEANASAHDITDNHPVKAEMTRLVDKVVDMIRTEGAERHYRHFDPVVLARVLIAMPLAVALHPELLDIDESTPTDAMIEEMGILMIQGMHDTAP